MNSNQMSGLKADTTHSYWKYHMNIGSEKSKLPTMTTSISDENTSYSQYDFPLLSDQCKKVNALGKTLGVSSTAIYYSVGIELLHQYVDEAQLSLGVMTKCGKFPLSLELSSDETCESLILNVHSILSNHEKESVPESFFYNEFNLSEKEVLYNFCLSYKENLEGMAVHSLFKPELEIEILYDIYPQIVLKYKEGVYTEQFITRLAQKYVTLIDKMITQVDKKLHEIDGLLEEEKSKLLYSFNKTQSQYPKDKLIGDLFEEQVSRTPNGVAVVWNDQTITYEKLKQKVDQIAFLLKQKGIGPEHVVGVLVKRSIDMVVSVLAILKAGGAYLPLEVSYPSERNMYMLEDSKASLVITQGDIDFHTELETILVDEIKNVEFENSNNVTFEKTSPNNLAYVIYTSGSTGKPKGVMVEQRQINNLIHYMQSEYKLNYGEVIVHRTNLTFDPSVWEMLWPLCFGGTVQLINKEEGMNPRFLLSLMQSHDNIKMVFLPSSLVKSILHLIEKQQNPKKIKTPYFHFGAEPITMDVLKTIYPYLDGVILNTYGPTECTVFNTYYYIYRDDNKNYVPIGKPIANNQTYILSKDLQLLPLGSIGEICIAGDSVSRGYMNQPKLTAEKFIRNPFGQGRLYRTGDLGKFDDEGNIEIIGRIDHQVKIRGHRIEIGEIEKMILSFESIKDCTVFVTGEGENKHLVAFLITSDSYNMNLLKKYLLDRLPEFMIPRNLVKVDQIPLTTNGKIDRQALLNKIKGTQISTKNDEDFTINTTTFILKTIKSILELNKDIRLTDDLKVLGMNSLTFVRFIVELEQHFQINFNKSEFLMEKFNTPYAFIDYITSLQASSLQDIGE